MEVVNNQRENFEEAARVVEEINFNVMNLHLINWKLVFGGVVLIIGSLWISKNWLLDLFISLKNLSWTDIFKKNDISVLNGSTITTTTTTSGGVEGFINIRNPKPWDTNSIYAFLLSIGMVGYKFKKR